MRKSAYKTKSCIKGKQCMECSSWMNIQCRVVQSQFLELHLVINMLHNFQIIYSVRNMIQFFDNLNLFRIIYHYIPKFNFI